MCVGGYFCFGTGAPLFGRPRLRGANTLREGLCCKPLERSTVYIFFFFSLGYFGEATLDSQYILASGEGVPTWDISHEQFDLLVWCQMVLNMTNPAKVLSISWGSSESGYQLDHMTATNTEFMKMGTLGKRVFREGKFKSCLRLHFLTDLEKNILPLEIIFFIPPSPNPQKGDTFF